MDAGALAVMVQYNSMRPELVAETLGVTQQQAEKHMANREHLLDWARNSIFRQCTEAGCTNIAASIVPDKNNYVELPGIIDDCAEHNVFPSLGELEKAGKSKGEYYDTHCLSDDELRSVLGYINTTYRIKYARSICPAALGAIHINNRNLVTVDEFTGLSCGWFSMRDPQMKVIGDIREMSYDEIVEAILKYRESRIPEVRAALEDYPEAVFGGCGGTARKLLTDYVDLYD